jgi:hypothetical protein
VLKFNDSFREHMAGKHCKEKHAFVCGKSFGWRCSLTGHQKKCYVAHTVKNCCKTSEMYFSFNSKLREKHCILDIKYKKIVFEVFWRII